MPWDMIPSRCMGMFMTSIARFSNTKISWWYEDMVIWSYHDMKMSWYEDIMSITSTTRSIAQVGFIFLGSLKYVSRKNGDHNWEIKTRRERRRRGAGDHYWECQGSHGFDRHPSPELDLFSFSVTQPWQNLPLRLLIFSFFLSLPLKAQAPNRCSTHVQKLQNERNGSEIKQWGRRMYRHWIGRGVPDIWRFSSAGAECWDWSKIWFGFEKGDCRLDCADFPFFLLGNGDGRHEGSDS